jgi:hypothetical protein
MRPTTTRNMPARHKGADCLEQTEVGSLGIDLMYESP